MNIKITAIFLIILGFTVFLSGCNYKNYEVIRTNETNAIQLFENYVVNSEMYNLTNGYSLLFVGSTEHYDEACESLFHTHYVMSSNYFYENCYEITYRFRVNSSNFSNIDYIIMSSYVMEDRLQNISMIEVPK
ncbi:MAG: hypothetical protein ACOCRX_02020 [Candidatus Woesearchaeota archaeon]